MFLLLQLFFSLLVMSLPILIPFLIIYLIVKGIKKVVSNKKEREFIDYCKSNRLEYNKKMSEYSDRYLSIKDSIFFYAGISTQFLYEMSGISNGIEFSIFTYKYYENTGEGTAEAYQTVCVFNKNGVVLPDFYMMKSVIKLGSAFNAVAKSVGNMIRPMSQAVVELASNFTTISNKDLYSADIIEFEEDKKFSDNYSVYSNNRKETRELFSNILRKTMLDNDFSFYFCHTVNNYFIVSRYGFLDLNSRIEMLKQCKKIFEVICNKKLSEKNINALEKSRIPH